MDSRILQLVHVSEIGGSDGEPFLNFGVIIAVLHSSGMECVIYKEYNKINYNYNNNRISFVSPPAQN